MKIYVVKYHSVHDNYATYTILGLYSESDSAKNCMHACADDWDETIVEMDERISEIDGSYEEGIYYIEDGSYYEITAETVDEKMYDEDGNLIEEEEEEEEYEEEDFEDYYYDEVEEEDEEEDDYDIDDEDENYYVAEDGTRYYDPCGILALLMGYIKER